MSVLVFAESQDKHFKKATFETVFYGAKVAEKLGTECIALTLGEVNGAEELGKYGASKVLNINNAALNHLDSKLYTAAISQVVKDNGANVVIVSHSSTGKAILGRLAVKLDAGSVSAINSIPETDGGFFVQKSVFGGKAKVKVGIETEVKVLSLSGNSFQPQEIGQNATVESINVDLPSPSVKVLETKTASGRVPLPEAELVVSAGRGMKGPENWGIIEELADALGATTACSRPVADSDWRPHHEHVGQTGVAIKPNLYIAVGISGAIQHLAGVNNSKVIVVINKDPEAPFFKAADYGVLGDLFDVVPKLTQAIKDYKSR